MDAKKEALVAQIYNIFKESGLTIREAHDIIDALKTKIFSLISHEREALYDEVIK